MRGRCRQSATGIHGIKTQLSAQANQEMLSGEDGLGTVLEGWIEYGYLEIGIWDFSGGTVVKNPPANAGGTGSSPGPGRSLMPRSNESSEPQLLSLHATATEARTPRARGPQQEKPLQ